MASELKDMLPTDAERDLEDMKLESQLDQERPSEETTVPAPEQAQPPHQPAFNPNADFKEGGIRGWLAVVGCWCVMFFTFGYLNAFGIYEAYYLETFLKNHSPSDVAWIGSIQVFAQFSGGLISGPICDRWGPQVCSISSSISYNWRNSTFGDPEKARVVDGRGISPLHSCLRNPASSCILTKSDIL